MRTCSYSNTAGLKVVGSHNALSELLILDTDWLGTLDYPPLEIGFGNDCDAHELVNASGCAGVPSFPGWSAEAARAARAALPPHPPGLRMYPRNPHGTNNSVTRATVGRSGNACIVTSQLSNQLSYSRVFGAGACPGSLGSPGF